MIEDKYGIGKKFTTNEGCQIEIIEKLMGYKRKAAFENGYEVIVFPEAIDSGKIKNPYHPSVYGVGYLGVGEYKCRENGKLTPEYRVWSHMLQRCYYDKYQERCPTYVGTMICKKWHNFQNFSKWYNENYPKIEGIKFDLDKDLLQENVRDKIYSPDTCIFLPKNVNTFLINKRSNNTSGFIGVSWSKPNKKWKAQIMVFGEGKGKNIGYFSTPEEASLAYQKARVEQAEKAKNYLRSISYLPEEIIQLIY